MKRVVISRFATTKVANRYEGVLKKVYNKVKRVTESLFPSYRTLYVWECLERKNK